MNSWPCLSTLLLLAGIQLRKYDAITISTASLLLLDATVSDHIPYRQKTIPSKATS
jgi:hypothetical protein